MSSLSTKLKLLLSDPTDFVDVNAQIDNNFSSLDLYASSLQCTSATRPIVTYDGLVIWETDTNLLRVWSLTLNAWSPGLNPTLLLSSAGRPVGAFLGDRLVETDTGISRVWDGFRWRPIGNGNLYYTEGIADYTGVTAAFTDVTGMNIGAGFTADGLTPYQLVLSVPNVLPTQTPLLYDQCFVSVFESINAGAYAEILRGIIVCGHTNINQFTDGFEKSRRITPTAATHQYKLQTKSFGTAVTWTIRGQATTPIILSLKEL